VERDDRRWWENPAGGVRAMSLWRDCGPFDVDCMASAGNVMCHPDTGVSLPFVSLSLDVGNRSVNVFATHWG